MLWIIIAALTAAALAALVAPFARARRGGADRAAHNLAVYSDQLREIDVDVERGVLQAGEADSARIEISRRMLDAAPSGDGANEDGGVPGGRTFGAIQIAGIAVIAIAVPAISVFIYVSGGSPEQAGSLSRAAPTSAWQSNSGNSGTAWRRWCKGLPPGWRAGLTTSTDGSCLAAATPSCSALAMRPRPTPKPPRSPRKTRWCCPSWARASSTTPTGP